MLALPLTLAAWALSFGAAKTPLASADSVPLYTNLGNHHIAISTKVPAAQQYFDQGMRLVYAFNHGEAIRAFEHAAALDPQCAICHWGAALASGPHVNSPMDSSAGVQAWAHLQQAVALKDNASPRERAYIEALAARYASPPPADRAPLDSAYARTMAGLVKQFPNDLDAATLYAEALMDLRPWNYWDKKGKPYPGTEIVVSQLERVLRASPNHPGACHYYIHAVEAVAPGKAVACAERLAALMPGAGHIVHMPGHIYVRVGRYNDAIEANVHAVHADESYIETEKPSGMYPIGYYPHNYHFLSLAATMAGRSKDAIAAARTLRDKVPEDVARAAPPLEALIAYHPLVLSTFGRWEEVLRAPLPSPDLRLASGLVYYARGVALAAQGKTNDAKAALDSVKTIADGTTPADQTALSAGAGENKTIMEIARHALLGELAFQRAQYPEAVQHFQVAAQLEDGFNYTEPPQWHHPIRHSLGEALLSAGRPADAERVYREDLARFPENGWSLKGLVTSLRAQKKEVQAKDAEERFKRAWAGADVTLVMSRF